MDRQKKNASSGFARLKLLMIMTIMAAGLILLFSNQFTKNGNEMPVALGGKEEDTVHISSDSSNSLEEEAAEDERFKVLIDAGHGGKDPGTTGVSGTFEKVSNLAIAMHVYELLKEDSRFEVRMTRMDDSFYKLEDRSAMANEWPADAFVSIHGNSYEDGSVSGSETFYRYDNGLLLAESVHGKLVDAMGFKDRGIRLNELKVLTLSQVPSVLIESGYLTNAAEEAVLLTEEGQTRMAQAIVDGIKIYMETITQSGE
ncbi:N-acetylmuramoyl-L-alanine amidase family protein [Paenibacillus sp. strain BS8-2]